MPRSATVDPDAQSLQSVTTCTATLTHPGDPAKVTDWDQTNFSVGVGLPRLHLGLDPERPLDINQSVGTAAIVFRCNPKSTSPNCTKPQWLEH
jgi:hypothetical protein